MATSKFLRTFRTTQGVPITTATIWLVPQANTYPTGALALTPHATRDGQYYRDNVPDGEYKIYIDPAGGSSPTLYEEEIWIGEARITTISDHFDSADSYKLKTTGIKNLAITAAHLASDAVETAKIKDANVTAAKLSTDAVETAKIKDLNVTNAKIANATILPAKLGQQTVTVVSTTNPTPSYIGQQGRDASGKTFIAIALSGTMWEESTKILTSNLAKASDGTLSIAVNKNNEIKFSRDNFQTRNFLLNTLRDNSKLNYLTGKNNGTGALITISGTGHSIAYADYDGSCIYTNNQITKMTRVTLAVNANYCQILFDRIYTPSTSFEPTTFGFWVRKSSLLSLERVNGSYPFLIEAYEMTGGATLSFTVGVFYNQDFQVGCEKTASSGSRSATIKIYAEYGDWLYFTMHYPVQQDTLNTRIRMRLVVYNETGDPVNLDFINPIIIGGVNLPIVDLIYPESAAQLSLYSGIPDASIGYSQLNSEVINDLSEINLELGKVNNRIEVSRLSERKIFYNLLKQPTESGYNSQFIFTAFSGGGSWELNDDSLPFSSNELSHFCRVNYNLTVANQQISKSIATSNQGYLISLWIRDIDIQNSSNGVEFYDLNIADWNRLTKAEFEILGDKAPYVNGVYSSIISVKAKFNGWTLINVKFITTGANFAGYYFYFKIVDAGSETGKLDFCNIGLFDGVNEVNGFDVYISSTDTVGIVPTFDNKAVRALQNSGILTNEVEDVLTANPSFITDPMSSEISKYAYGANIQNFLKKCRDYQSGRYASKAPTVVIIGDSITGGGASWANYLVDLLVDQYGVPEENILPIHWYGGASTNYMMPFVENALIHPNVDLVVWAEYESPTNDNYLIRIEQIIQLIRTRTTADICITTWGSGALTGIYNSGTPLSWSEILDIDEYKHFNWYRDLARRYNCELLDYNQALIEWVLAGNDPSTIYTSAPHVNSAGYDLYNAETLKHFNNPSWQKRMNIPNVLHDVEKLIILDREFIWQSFYGSQKEISFANKSNWSASFPYITSGVNGEYILISFYGTGFELFYNANASHIEVWISDDGGTTWAAPSDIRINSKPLEYCTEVISITYASNWDNWRLKRPAMHIEVLDNVLANGTLISGQYKIKVINIVENGASPDTVTCEIFDPVGTSLGTFIVGNAYTFASGKLRIPQTWNGQNNYYNSATYSSWVLNEEFEFYIRSNWIDDINTTSAGSSRVVGLENKSYVVKLLKVDTGNSRLTYIKIFNPILGRSM